MLPFVATGEKIESINLIDAAGGQQPSAVFPTASFNTGYDSPGLSRCTSTKLSE